MPNLLMDQEQKFSESGEAQIKIPEVLPVLPLREHSDISFYDRAFVCSAREINKGSRSGII